MNKILGLITVSVILISCQKEINFANGSNNGGSDGALLVKSKTVSATDSTEVNYYYDANKRLLRQSFTGAVSGQDLSHDITFVRNNSGIIMQAIYKSPAFQAFGIDSVVSTVYYDNNSKKYTAVSQVLDLSGLTVTDSTAFSYNGNNIVEANEFQSFSGLNFLASKTDFTYTGSNLTLMKTYATDSTGNFGLVQTDKSTYDNKTSMLTLAPVEAFLLGNYGSVSANNPLTFQVLDGSGGIIGSNTFTYTYNSSNRPQSAKIVDVSGTTATSTFYYQ